MATEMLLGVSKEMARYRRGFRNATFKRSFNLAKMVKEVVRMGKTKRCYKIIAFMLVVLTTNNELTALTIDNGGSAVIDPVIRYSPTAGEKIVDRSALGQYNPNNYLHYDAFNFHGEYQGNNAQELIPKPDPTDTITLPSDFPVLGNIFTIEAEVYSTAHEKMPHRTIIGNNANPANNEGDRPPTITLNKIGGINQIRYGFGIGPDLKGKQRIVNSVLTDDQWYHIAFTFDGTNTKLYVDGIEVDNSDFASGLTPHPVPISLIGRNFLGKMDEVRIWNIARTQEDIQSTMSGTLVGNEQGLIAYYPMDVNQDWKLLDKSPNNYHATVIDAEILQRYTSVDCPNPNGTLTCPYPTIREALEKSQGGDRIFVREGRYSEVIFKELLNSSYETNGTPITLRGESANVILDGTVPLITNWKFVNGKYEALVDMNQLSIIANAKIEDIHGLWIDDRYMIPAMPVNFSNPTDISTSNQNNPESGTIFEANLTAPYQYNHMVQDEYIVGDINNLDSEEEWSFDKVDRKLFVIPGDNIPDLTNVRVRVRTKILNFEYSDNIVFKTLHFFAGTFNFNKSSFILLEDSKFSHSWEAGMSYLRPGMDPGWERGNFFKGGTNNIVRNCIFQYINDAFALGFRGSMYPLAENVLFQYNDWFKNTVWAAGASDNFRGGKKWYNATTIGGSTFRYVTMNQNHTGGLQPGLESLVEYARIQNQYINIDGSGIQRTQGNVLNSTTRYSWLLNTNRNGMRLDSKCGGTDAIIHNVVSAGNKRGFRLKGDRHRAFHLLAYDTRTNDISMPKFKYCGDNWGNHDGVNSETNEGNLNSRILNSIAEKNLGANTPDAGDPNITLGNGELIAKNISNEFLLNQSGIWFGRALDEDKTAPFTYPHFELQDPWVENRYRSDESLQSHFGLNPFTKGVQGYDFRPRKDSPLLDGGVLIPGINDGQDVDLSEPPNHPPSYTGQHRAFVGNAPDIGAYEYGDSVYWIPGYRYYYATVPIPGNGAVDIPMEYGLAFNYPWKTDYSYTTAIVTINGPGVNKAVSLNYPNNVVFETFLPGQKYTWSVKVDDVSSQIWGFTVANKIHPLNDRSVDINADDEKLIPNQNRSLSLSDGVLSFLRFDIPSSINTNYQIHLNLTPETVASLNGEIMLYKYNYQGWGESLDTNNIGLLDHSLLTPLKSISTIDPSTPLSIEITDYIDSTGEISFALGVSDPNDQLSFYSKEKMVTDGVGLYVAAGDLLGPSGNGSGYAPQVEVWPNISFVKKNPTSTTDISVLPCEHDFTFAPGWHIISLPCQVEDPSLVSLFPDAISLFEFGGGYQSASSMEIGKGYWINLPQASTSSITGAGPSSLSIGLPAAWSMVGPGPNPVSASSLGDNVISVFGFDAGYVSAATLEPGQGYWANLSSAGQLDLSGSAAAKPTAAQPQKEGVGHAFLWAEAAGRQQMLHLGVEARDVEALPPVPPRGLFDVRVEVNGVGAWQVPLANEARDYRLNFQGGSMELGWKIPREDHGLWQLVVNERVIDLEGEGMVPLEPGVDQVFVRQQVSRALPQVYALQQNYPNPFNPGTTIQYSLPEAGQVSLKIYDMAGQVVRHLVDQHQNAGSHQVIWDGLDGEGEPTANGVYIYELRAGEYRALRKMLLIK